MKMMGSLYIVATPIGNLEDMTSRAISILRSVDVIAAEDTRQTKKLLNHFNIHAKRLITFHEHNENKRVEFILQLLEGGEHVAVVSDAGTPLINDPGYRLVHRARATGIRVIPIPGACALIAALSVSGLPTDRFVFEGFLGGRSVERMKRLNALAQETRTMIFYEAPHRIKQVLTEMAEVFGHERVAVLARELTKVFETVSSRTLGNLLSELNRMNTSPRGEFVILVSGLNKPGRKSSNVESDERTRFILKTLLEELPASQAVKLTARLTGYRKNQLYKWVAF
jgi:16S rRNA (cytidine1402-2'-O)-methyltransferase